MSARLHSLSVGICAVTNFGSLAMHFTLHHYPAFYCVRLGAHDESTLPIKQTGMALRAITTFLSSNVCPYYLILNYLRNALWESDALAQICFINQKHPLAFVGHSGGKRGDGLEWSFHEF